MSAIKARLHICKNPLPLSLPFIKMCLFRREPLALINLKKKNEETGEEELASRLDHCKAKATRHIFLIRHSQYHLDGRADKDRTLTPLGRYHLQHHALHLEEIIFYLMRSVTQHCSGSCY